MESGAVLQKLVTGDKGEQLVQCCRGGTGKFLDTAHIPLAVPTPQVICGQEPNGSAGGPSAGERGDHR